MNKTFIKKICSQQLGETLCTTETKEKRKEKRVGNTLWEPRIMLAGIDLGEKQHEQKWSWSREDAKKGWSLLPQPPIAPWSPTGSNSI